MIRKMMVFSAVATLAYLLERGVEYVGRKNLQKIKEGGEEDSDPESPSEEEDSEPESPVEELNKRPAKTLKSKPPERRNCTLKQLAKEYPAVLKRRTKKSLHDGKYRFEIAPLEDNLNFLPYVIVRNNQLKRFSDICFTFAVVDGTVHQLDSKTVIDGVQLSPGETILEMAGGLRGFKNIQYFFNISDRTRGETTTSKITVFERSEESVKRMEEKFMWRRHEKK